MEYRIILGVWLLLLSILIVLNLALGMRNTQRTIALDDHGHRPKWLERLQNGPVQEFLGKILMVVR